MLSRRAALGSLLVMAGANRAIGAPTASLATVAGRSGRWFGAAIRPEQLTKGGDLGRALLRECARFTPELALKWAALEAEPGVLDFSEMDTLARVAAANGKRLRGHVLLWHRSIPVWAMPKLAEADGWRLIDAFLASVMPRYGATVDSWDVVNEPVEPGARADGLRVSPFLAAFGPSYIRRALGQARLYAPRATLAINEYGLDYALPEEAARRAALLRLVEDLRGRGAPLDQVGVQAHLDLGKGPFDERVFSDFLAALAATGVRIAITELDVKEHAYAAPREERDRLVAELVGRYLDVALAQKAVVGVTTWGLSDASSWLEVSAADRARFPGAWTDGSSPGLNRGLPLDADLRRKPMYYAIERAFLRHARSGSTL